MQAFVENDRSSRFKRRSCVCRAYFSREALLCLCRQYLGEGKVPSNTV